MPRARVGILLRRTLVRWLAGLAACLAAAAGGHAADDATIEISMRLDNVLGFSPLEKTYTMEGTIWLVYDADLARVLDEKGVAPIDLIRFQKNAQRRLSPA